MGPPLHFSSFFNTIHLHVLLNQCLVFPPNMWPWSCFNQFCKYWLGLCSTHTNMKQGNRLDVYPIFGSRLSAVSLRFFGRIPTSVEVHHVARSGEIQPHTPGLPKGSKARGMFGAKSETNSIRSQGFPIPLEEQTQRKLTKYGNRKMMAKSGNTRKSASKRTQEATECLDGLGTSVQMVLHE